MAYTTKILGVHGYGLNGALVGVAALSAKSEQVCAYVAKNHQRYDVIVLLGGWDETVLTPKTTIGGLMCGQLVRENVPREKLLVPQHDIASIKGKYKPPRDTCEEAVLFRRTLLDLNSYRGPPVIECVALEPWIPRIKHIYRKVGIRCGKFNAVPMPAGERAPITEMVARLVAMFDPLGMRAGPGLLFRNNRASRTLSSYGESLLKP